MGTLCFLLFSAILLRISQATIFEITNHCSYTVWAAANPGGGKQLKPDETWVLNIMAFNDTNPHVQIWGRTNCTFDASGSGSCKTGDCKKWFDCQDYGDLPITIVEFTVGRHKNKDFYDMTLLRGFNIPMKIIPSDSNCREVSCTADIKGECPVELRAPGGCNHPCKVFNTDLYCCKTVINCKATYLSNFFKTKCPDAYSFARDDQTSFFTCPTGSNYRVLFCPSVSPPPSPSPSLPHVCVRIRY